MKSFMTVCAAALALMALANQQASAWTKSNFSVGLTWNREASDNSWIHGWIYQNGPHPYAQGGYGGPVSGGYDGGMPFASTQPMQPMLPAPREMPSLDQPKQTVAPATYWFPAN
jgi:hypothetical protein